MSWEGQVFVDTTLPFGLRSAPIIFSAVADALLWIMQKKVSHLHFTIWTISSQWVPQDPLNAGITYQ